MRLFHYFGMLALLLLFVGLDAIYIALKNPSPAKIKLSKVIDEGPPKKWIRVNGGVIDPTMTLTANTPHGGKLKEAYLPLVRSIGDTKIDVVVLTRDTLVLDFLNEHRSIETSQSKEIANFFFESRLHEFQIPREVEGLASTYGEMSSRTRRKLRKNYENLAELPILIEEGESPSESGPYLTLFGVLAGTLSFYLWRRSKHSNSGKT